MNWKGVPPNDWHTEDASAEEREQLSEIERRLKAARLNPIQFSPAAWERIISASESPGMPEAETVLLARRARSSHRGWANRAVGKIAAIWLSGVVVGSGAIFLMMSRGPDIAQTDNSQTSIALPPRNLAPRNPAPSLVSPETESQLTPRPSDIATDAPNAKVARSGPAEPSLATDADETHAAMTVDSMHEIRWAAWLEAPALGPKIPLRPFGKELFESPPSRLITSRSRASETAAEKEWLQQSDSQRELASSFVPPPGATPRRIWEELRMDTVALGRSL